MIDAVLAKIFGTQNERDVKALRPRIAAINALSGLRVKPKTTATARIRPRIIASRTLSKDSCTSVAWS